jgi:RNA recognition motif-containing protein
MGKRLYVGNLPYQADEPQLRELFGQDGRQVEEVKIVTDRETGRPRGFAFVEMATDDQAAAAVEALNGKPFGGRPLTVSEARERTPGGGGGGGGGGRGGYGRR